MDRGELSLSRVRSPVASLVPRPLSIFPKGFRLGTRLPCHMTTTWTLLINKSYYTDGKPESYTGTVSRVGKLKVMENDWRINWIVFYSRRKAELVSWCPEMMYFPVVCFTILGLCIHIHTLRLEISMLLLQFLFVFPKRWHIFETWAFSVDLLMRSCSKYWQSKFSNRIISVWTASCSSSFPRRWCEKHQNM